MGFVTVIRENNWLNTFMLDDKFCLINAIFSDEFSYLSIKLNKLMINSYLDLA